MLAGQTKFLTKIIKPPVFAAMEELRLLLHWLLAVFYGDREDPGNPIKALLDFRSLAIELPL